MILVTGATGTIGSAVIRRLAERGAPARSMVRDLSRASGPAVLGDFERPDTLRAAAEGAEAVLLVTPFGAGLAEHDRAMVRAAEAAGVRRIVKISAIGAEDTGDLMDVRTMHAAGELAVTSSALTWTILRPSMFATNALGWAEGIRAGLPVQNMTGKGRQGIIDPGDIADVAVEALTSAGHGGRIYTLTGPHLLSTADQVELIGKAAGRAATTVDVPPAQARAQLLEMGADPVFVEVAMTGWGFVAGGGNEIVTTDVSDVLGRPATSFAAWAETNAAAFTGQPGSSADPGGKSAG
ncbi:NAD(P)H-binding protein [Nonomuraea longicatena]|uniref:SDR family oxidoreductase n=1 Tax=Nonomuraea longicatena TaxID=83682 RepID=A0ABN1NQH4_9ACTN